MYAQVSSSKIKIVKETLRLLGSSLFSIRKVYDVNRSSKVDVLKVLPGLIDQANYIIQNVIDDLYKEENVDHGHFLLVLQKALEGLYSYTVDLLNKENLTEEETYIVLTFIADSVFNIERML